jgi:hypothetical protein
MTQGFFSPVEWGSIIGRSVFLVLYGYILLNLKKDKTSIGK